MSRDEPRSRERDCARLREIARDGTEIARDRARLLEISPAGEVCRRDVELGELEQHGDLLGEGAAQPRVVEPQL